MKLQLLTFIILGSIFHMVLAQDSISSSPEYQVTLDEKLIEQMEEGDTAIIHNLLRQGANVNKATYEGVTPVMYAAIYGHLEAAKLLLDYGADVNISPYDGNTPLMVAAEQEDIEMGELFILNSGDIGKMNSEGYSALHISVLNGNYYFADMLLYYEATVDQRTKEGATALTLACYNGDYSLVELLVNGGADPDLYDKDMFTPLMAAVQEGHEEVAKLLLVNGASPDFKNEDGLTALCFAVKNGFKSITEMLIEHGADYNITFGNGFNLIYLAEKNHHYDIKKYLKELGLKTQIGFHFEKMYLGTGVNVSVKDAMYLFDIGLKEPRYNLYIGLIYMNRFGKVPIIETDEVSINQYREKRSYIGFDFGKEIKIYEITNITNIGISANCKGLFTYGKYEALERKPIGSFVLTPSVGIFYRKDFFGVDMQYQYLNVGVEEFPKSRIVITTHFDIPFNDYVKEKTFY